VLNQNKSKMGFKWGQELLKAKAIIADLYQTILALREENEELKAEIAMIKKDYKLVKKIKSPLVDN
jgi:hypothetical protein